MEHGQKAETISEFSERTGRNWDTVVRAAKKKIPTETWGKYSAVTPELIAALSAGKSAKEKRPRSVPAKASEVIRLPEKPDTPPARQALPSLPKLDLSNFLIVAVYGHTLLVWYEISQLFGVPGLLAGVIVFAMKHAGLMICRNEKYLSLGENALSVAFVLDALALYVHYTVFSDALPPHIAAQMGSVAAARCAGVLGGVVATGAWVAMWMVKLITAKKMFPA
ncbi:MAG: hypothetical protein IPK73_30735 [Candidatus Obscuribacter sp.]|nr:hypothetical protein [Candidatus Obscuribacter sp.]